MQVSAPGAGVGVGVGVGAPGVGVALGLGVGVEEGPEPVVTSPIPSPQLATIMARAKAAPKTVLFTSGNPLRVNSDASGNGERGATKGAPHNV